MTYVIRDLPAANRPRERLLAHGPRVLSDAELLAIILGTGAAGKNAIHLAQELLVETGLTNLHRRDMSAISRTRGVGPAKAARIMATLELSRRLSIPPDKKRSLFDLHAFGQKLIATHSHYTEERVGAALLDARQRVMQQREIFVGSIDKAIVSTREIVRYGLVERASGVVVYHNHPSGDPKPSEEDITFSKQLQQALVAVDLHFVDHLIVGAHSFLSMKARGYL